MLYSIDVTSSTYGIVFLAVTLFLATAMLHSNGISKPILEKLRDFAIANVLAFERPVSPRVHTTDLSFYLCKTVELLFLLIGRSR